jgi:hypothetical protein
MDQIGTDPSERAEAVRAFDTAYGHMERSLWTLSRACRPFLLRGEKSPLLEGLVWTLKSWMGVQGVRSDTRRAMGAALATLMWTPECFDETYLHAGEAERFACESVSNLVSARMPLGVPRREYSLASKVLHWLMPWRVPIYDAFVRAEGQGAGIMGPSAGVPANLRPAVRRSQNPRRGRYDMDRRQGTAFASSRPG